MKVKVSEIQADGVRIDTPSALDHPFSDPTWRLDSVALLLERDEVEVHVTGTIDATVPLTCGRCLELLPTHVHADVDMQVVPRRGTSAAIELGARDLDTDFYDNDELDVDALVEAETTLAIPMKPLCRDECRGLCPVCGGNRNLVQCACQERAPDPRLAALRELAARFNKS
jgi:uncharacterized protein